MRFLKNRPSDPLHGNLSLSASHFLLNMSIEVVFFSRGRGFGHAIPDLAIAAAMCSLNSEIHVRFVSYSTGAKVLKNAGWPVIDLELPEMPLFIPALLACHQVLANLECDLVIVHEEFAALPIAKLFAKRCVFISAWLPPPNTIPAESLLYADDIIVLGEPGIFPLPIAGIRTPKYVGNIVRDLSYGPDDRQKARSELLINSDCFVVLVVSGGWANEHRAPIGDVVADAFARISSSNKLLFWLAGEDFDRLSLIFREETRIKILRFAAPVEKWIAASDVVVTKGSRGITLEAQAMRIPSISLSFGLNPMDDLLIARIAGNTCLNASAVDGVVLHEYIERSRQRRLDPPSRESGTISGIAKYILERWRSGVRDS